MVAPSSQKQVHVLVLPFPAQGHMLPLLDLAHLLSSRFPRLALTVVVTPANLPLISPLLSRSPSIRPLAIPFPTGHPSLPTGIENTQGLPPQSFRPLIHVLGGLRDPLLRWARARLDDDRVSAIISDFFFGWSQYLAAELGVPRLVFCPSGALTLAGIHDVWRRLPKPSNPGDLSELVRFDSLPGSPCVTWRQLFYMYRSYIEGDPESEFIKDGFLNNTKSWGYVFNTFAELENAYMEHLRTDLGHARVWALGPLVQPGDNPTAAAGRGGRSSIEYEEVAAWLDGCAEGSVVYVCFGSQAALPPKQAEALATGLERSGSRFLWCTRDPSVIPEGFEERTAPMGKVVRGWAPQVAILGHGAVGSFVTHCGWNSVLEAVTAGVTMLAWPMTADQHFTAWLLTEEAGLATRLCMGGEEEVPDADELARAIAESVGESRRERRERALEMGRRAREAVKEGGSSYVDLERMVQELVEEVIGKQDSN